MDFFQLADGDLGVDLDCLQLNVTEHGLGIADIEKSAPAQRLMILGSHSWPVSSSIVTNEAWVC